MPSAGPGSEPTPAIPMSLRQHDLIMRRRDSGELTLEQFRAGFQALMANKAALMQELSSLTKEDILRRMSSMGAARHKSESKDRVIESALIEMITDYRLGKAISLAMTHDLVRTYELAVGRVVAAVTQTDLADYAKRVAEEVAKNLRRLERMHKALHNPETLEEFQEFIRSNGEDALSAAQLETFDRLRAADSLARLRANQERLRAERSTVRAVGQKVGAQVIDTKHTKHGYDIFVVQLAERVEREVYEKFNVAAKKAGRLLLLLPRSWSNSRIHLPRQN
jgi:uncharacterized protein YbgA (DUF1722 family)